MRKYQYHASQLMIDFDVVFAEEEDEIFELSHYESVRTMLPVLRDHQCEDVVKAEKRFEVGKGMLFTNGTGTGKTYVGLGVAYRFFERGLGNIIIVVPTDKKATDWIKDGRKLNLQIYQLQGINDNGRSHGIVVTTYANFYQNDAIEKREFDLVIYDESHYLNQNQQGKETVYLEKHRHIANLPSKAKIKAKELISVQRPHYDEIRQDDYWPRLKIYEAALKEKAQELIDSTKVLFLSATPFAYHKSLIYGDGSLWEINETLEVEYSTTAYNEASGYSKFMIENFGYRMRYNKCTVPESGVDVNLMERNFFEKMSEAGIMSTRQIQLNYDYSRQFVTIDSEIGDKINDGIELFYDEAFQEKYKELSKIFRKKYNYNYMNQLLECVKAQEVHTRIQQHLDLGRKVVIFHGYNNSVLSHPFRFRLHEILTDSEIRELDIDRHEFKKEVDRYEKQYPQFFNLDLSSLKNTREAILTHFPNAKQFNGLISKKKRSIDINDFNNDYGFSDVILVQEKAGAEGIDLHDTTGLFQRVLMQLGLPVQPTKSTQIEGRTYRDGLKSNTMYEYFTLQTVSERIAFGTKIAERARTVENLAMGNLARNLEQAFKEGYIDSDYEPPSLEQGTGGKEKDGNKTFISEFDKAKTYYFSRAKRNSKNKAREGIDYFATPEPLGLKLIEWIKPKEDEHGLEPSAGHGAISRFFPAFTNNHYIEPSVNLFSELTINSHGEFKNDRFENHSVINKYDFIVMNPPFGISGKTAMEHVKKSLVKHCSRYDSFRLIAIIPAGPAMGKRLDEFLLSDEGQKYHLEWQIRLPSNVFERAGTNVSCNIIKITKYKMSCVDTRKIDLSYIKTITEFFETIETMEM